jgi:hypothetical protein
MTEPASPERTFTKNDRSVRRSIQIAPGNRLSVLALLVRTFRFSEIFIEQGWHLEQWATQLTDRYAGSIAESIRYVLIAGGRTKHGHKRCHQRTVKPNRQSLESLFLAKLAY